MIAIFTFLFLATAVLAKERHRNRWDDLADSELKLEDLMGNEFLEGKAHWARYVVGVLAVVLFLTTCGGCLMLLCYANFLCFGCCGSTGRVFFRFLRALGRCLCFWRKPVEYGCVSSYAPFAGDFDQAASECHRELVPLTNSRGVLVHVPYCQRHSKPLQERIFKKDRRFEANATYPINVHFGEAHTRLAVAALVNEEVARARTYKNQADGYIYMFHNTDDTRYVKFPPASGEPYLYKIGMTERTPKERLSEWSGAVMDGAWRTSSVFAAEQLIHAMHAQDRIARFNVGGEKQKFEVEWFYATKEDLQQTIGRVIDTIKSKHWDDLKQI